MLKNNFKNVINEIKEEIKNIQFKTTKEVNSNLNMLYFRTGKIVSENKSYELILQNKFLKN